MCQEGLCNTDFSQMLQKKEKIMVSMSIFSNIFGVIFQYERALTWPVLTLCVYLNSLATAGNTIIYIIKLL